MKTAKNLAGGSFRMGRTGVQHEADVGCKLLAELRGVLIEALGTSGADLYNEKARRGWQHAPGADGFPIGVCPWFTDVKLGATPDGLIRRWGPRLSDIGRCTLKDVDLAHEANRGSLLCARVKEAGSEFNERLA